MDPPAYKCQPSIPDSRLSDLADDFLFGFDVDDEDDRAFLADVAIHRRGPDDEIRSFIRIGLRRGVEEWEQALCRASAMHGRASPRDGRDVLSFLSTVYGVDALSRPGGGDSRQRLEGSRAQRTLAKNRGSLRAGVPLGRIDKKHKKARDSPYWADTPTPVCRETDQMQNGSNAGGTARRGSKKRKRSAEVLSLRQPTVRMGSSRDDEAGRICAGPGLKDGSINNGPEYRCATSDELSVRVQDINTSGRSREAVGNNEKTDDSGTNEAATTNSTIPSSPHKQPTPRRKAKSPYFDETAAATRAPGAVVLKTTDGIRRRPPRGTVPSLPFPRLDAPRFGLIQEELADDPFRLLVAVTLLIRTSGKAAIPVFRALMQRYPTPQALVDAPAAGISAMIGPLGLGLVRAATIQRYARIWLAAPPRNGVRYAVRNYAGGGCDGYGYGDVRGAGGTSPSAWEIGHMTQGPYALDSWRIFCRDVLRGVATDWRGGGREGEFQPEWMRVLPRDKELRACLRWMWMQEGWQWDPATGERVVLSDDLRRAVQEGRVGYDNTGDLRILD
ncbi:DNA glycosylase [Xylaria intraflava]|nr:DNA glycosylase [Xylaria intraflava]